MKTVNNGGHGMLKRAFEIAPLICFTATWLLSIYPEQLAMQGDAWVDFVEGMYPA
jgi:hypothetical protein